MKSTPETRRDFEQAIFALCNFSDANACVVYSYIKRTLRQFNLDRICSVEEIISEVYVRGIASIEAGKTIDKPLAWLKVTCLNVIREMSRSRNNQLHRLQGLDSDWIEHEALMHNLADDSTVDEFIHAKLAAIRDSLSQLSLKEQELLRLRFAEGLSWKQVGDRLAVSGWQFQDEVTLRKQGSRAIKRLRKVYDGIVKATEC